MNWILLQNSLVVSGSATILALAVGFVAALFASSRSKPVQMVVLASSLLVLALPPFLVTNTWMHYFGLTGVWRAFLDWNVYSLSGTILLLALSFWPIGFLLFYSALKKVTRAQLELDPELRGNRLLKWVIIPALKDSAIVAAAAIFVLAFNNFTIPALLQVKVYPAELWLRFNVNFNFLEALQLGWPMLLGPLCLLLIAQSKEIDFRFKGGVVMESALLNKRLGAPWLVVSCLLSAALIFFAAFLPLFQLATSARTFVELAPAFLAGKSALFNSVVISTLAALAALFLSLFSRKIKTIGGLAWVIYLAPGILLGITLVFIFNRPATTAFYQSLGLVIFGLAVRYLAPVWSGWRVAQQTIPQGWNEVMKLHGGSSFQRFQFLDLPSLHRQVFALFFIAYIFCLWDVETLIFFVPAGKETLSIRIFNMLHYGHANQVNALCVIMLGAALLPLLIYGASLKWFQWKKVQAGAVLLVAILGSGCGSKSFPSHELKSQFFSDVEELGVRGTGAGQFNKPRSVIVDKEQNIFVMDITGRMQKFTKNRQYAMAWQMPETDIGKPKGMTIDEEGNVVLVEPHYSRVNHFTSNGQLLYQWGKAGRSPGEFVFPRSIAITTNGDSYLSEYGLAERIQRFSKHGEKFLASIGEPGNGPGQFNRVEGLGLDAQNRLYAADSCNHRIQVFSPDGKLLSIFGKAGSGLGEMSYPYDIRIDKHGYKFVCEFGNSRIQVFGPANEPLEIIGNIGSEPGQFFNPWSIALDDQGNLYVADSGNHRVQIFKRKQFETKAPSVPATARNQDNPATHQGTKPSRS